ncbi:MAG TPA: hypothetical protein DD624_02060 [Alphaproteobacteria bacterium]|nr:hypothetical protein [Alphaproteobacteria bacterium]
MFFCFLNRSFLFGFSQIFVSVSFGLRISAKMASKQPFVKSFLYFLYLNHFCIFFILKNGYKRITVSKQKGF